MNSYDRIDETRQLGCNSSSSNSNISNNSTTTIQLEANTQSLFDRIILNALKSIKPRKETISMTFESNNDIISHLDERSNSTVSFYSETFQLKKRLWNKNRLLLIITGSIIILIIILITILIIEPWK